MSAPAPPSETPSETPSQIGGRLEIGTEIGSGAIARVVRVRDTASGTAYAAKILHPRHRRDETARRRFEREAELARSLRHENLIAVHGIHELVDADGELHRGLLMELVEGETLADTIARAGSLDEHDLLPIARGMAAGLAHAHAMGVIHRDLKPANILVVHGGFWAIPKVADFGMARAASFAQADRRAMTVLGTPPYMAPECLEPLAVDARTDLYAFGCILYEMATGRPPYQGATPYAVLDAHRREPIPALPETVSPALRDLVTKLLAKSPGDRPQSASAVAAALGGSDPTQALLPATVHPSAIARGRCAGCGEAVLPDLRVCFSCGLVQARLEPGPNTVFIVGPGKVGHRLPVENRERLVAWMRSNAAAGLDATTLEARIPWLPFVFVEAVSDASAQTLVGSLARLGLQAEFRAGGAFAHADMGKLVLQLTGRRLGVLGAIFGVPFFIHPLVGVMTLVPALALGAPALFLLSRRQARRAAQPASAARPDALPPRLREALERLHALIDGIEARRHREALRAVVDRVVSLTHATAPEARPEIDAEMGHAVAVAAVAATRIDALDRTMGEDTFDPALSDHRALMHERDMWSARLLDLTATLDALASRRAVAGAVRDDADASAILEELRHAVESLEEVQSL